MMSQFQTNSLLKKRPINEVPLITLNQTYTQPTTFTELSNTNKTGMSFRPNSLTSPRKNININKSSEQHPNGKT
jgi:hypothetical protein